MKTLLVVVALLCMVGCGSDEYHKGWRAGYTHQNFRIKPELRTTTSNGMQYQIRYTPILTVKEDTITCAVLVECEK